MIIVDVLCCVQVGSVTNYFEHSEEIDSDGHEDAVTRNGDNRIRTTPTQAGATDTDTKTNRTSNQNRRANAGKRAARRRCRTRFAAIKLNCVLAFYLDTCFFLTFTFFVSTFLPLKLRLVMHFYFGGENVRVKHWVPVAVKRTHAHTHTVDAQNAGHGQQ
jgi:hypothetical protein